MYLSRIYTKSVLLRFNTYFFSPQCILILGVIFLNFLSFSHTHMLAPFTQSILLSGRGFISTYIRSHLYSLFSLVLSETHSAGCKLHTVRSIHSILLLFFKDMKFEFVAFGLYLLTKFTFSRHVYFRFTVFPFWENETKILMTHSALTDFCPIKCSCSHIGHFNFLKGESL